MNDIIPHGGHRNMIVGTQAVTTLAEGASLEGEVWVSVGRPEMGTGAAGRCEKLERNQRNRRGSGGSFQEIASIHRLASAGFTPA